MRTLHSLTRTGIATGIVAVLLIGLSSGNARADSVRGFGKVALDAAPLSISRISVDAWLDDDGVAYGTIAWIGDTAFAPVPGGPADPFIIDVQDIVFDGNTAYVTGVVVASPEGLFNGFVETLIFTDNGGTAEPDEIDGEAIVAGNITVSD